MVVVDGPPSGCCFLIEGVADAAEAGASSTPTPTLPIPLLLSCAALLPIPLPLPPLAGGAIAAAVDYPVDGEYRTEGRSGPHGLASLSSMNK